MYYTVCVIRPEISKQPYAIIISFSWACIMPEEHDFHQGRLCWAQKHSGMSQWELQLESVIPVEGQVLNMS